MSQKSTVTEYSLHTSSMNHLEDVLDYIDILHSAASEGTTATYVGELDEDDVLSTLRDIIYTAQETVAELELKRAKKKRRERQRKQAVLHIVPKVEKAG